MFRERKYSCRRRRIDRLLVDEEDHLLVGEVNVLLFEINVLVKEIDDVILAEDRKIFTGRTRMSSYRIRRP